MSRYARPTDERKQKSEKNRLILKAVLKEPGNKTCADCKSATHPRWASWNLGVFICIRCSGIHRSMGTHISKVKSVDLDTWTEEQVESMLKWGNEKANMYWEAKLKSSHTPDDSKIENFIRTKYELKKWALSRTIPDPSTLVPSGSTGTSASASAASVSSPVSTSTATAATANRRGTPTAPETAKSHQPVPQAANLLDLDFGSSVSSVKPTAPATATASSTPSNRQSPVTPVGSSTSSASLSTADLLMSTQAAPAVGSAYAGSSRPDLKKSILSLYANSATGSMSSANSISSKPLGSSAGVVNSSSGLNLMGSFFDSPSTSSVQPTQSAQSSSQSLADPFASLSIKPNNSSSSTTTSNTFGDDLYANVWK